MLAMFGRKTDHPMADMKSALALLGNLPMNDALKSLQELSVWIESVREQESFRLDYQFELLRLLDETARPFERKLMREYYVATELSAFHENRLWMVLNEFSTQSLLGYLTVHVRYCNGDKGAASIKDVMPLMAARGINAAKGMLKSAAARYALFDHAIWEGLAEFYIHAEENNYLDEAVELYAGASAKTTVRKEFAALMMWYASSFGSLGRLQMHLAERLSSHFSDNYTVSAQRGKGSLFVFDPLYPMSPMRLASESVPQPSLRFLGVNKLNAQIIALLKMLEKNIVPEDINLGGVYEVGVLREVVFHLAERLASPPPVRRNVRHEINVSLSVTKGFSGVMEQTSVGLNFGSDSSMVWQVEDVSISGLRCVLPASSIDGVGIGLLLGTKPDKADYWGVGIVRRIVRDARKNLHIGIELLSNQVGEAELRENDGDEELHALWLDNPGGDESEVDVLVPPDTFTSSRSLHARVNGKDYLLMPMKLVERGEDYELARYRKVERDSSSD